MVFDKEKNIYTIETGTKSLAKTGNKREAAVELF
jgi:hypothetical protein